MAKIELLKQKEHWFLWINDYLWMWDIPVEQEAQQRIAQRAFGRILVAGYGLGICQRYLLQNPRVTALYTVELLPGLIPIVRPAYGQIFGQVVVGDFYQLPLSGQFDCVIGDIWQDILPECLNEYKRFFSRAQALIRPGGQVLAWGQEFFEALIAQENS